MACMARSENASAEVRKATKQDIGVNWAALF